MAEGGRWFQYKANLAGLNPIFTELDHKVFRNSGTLSFEPALIARHAQRLGELLDRCLNIRKDIRELEVLDVKAQTDYQLFIATSKIDEELELLRLETASKAQEQTGFHSAAATFSLAASLEKGLSEIAQGRDGALGQEIKTANDMKSLVEKRWQQLRQYQDDYHSRHIAKGNAHNYGERANLLSNVLTVLLDEALARADALAAGIQLIYGVALTDVPTNIQLHTLDEFAVWALKTIRSLSHATEEETTFELVLPLVQPWLPNQKPLVDKKAFDQAIANAGNGKPILLSFDLPQNDLLDGRTRLKGIGISFGNSFSRVDQSGIDRNQTADAFTRLAVKIMPPEQGGDTRPSVFIGNAGLHGASEKPAVEGNSVENRSPFGNWSVQIHPFLVWKDHSRVIASDPNQSDVIRDLKLSLRFYIPGTYSPVA